MKLPLLQGPLGVLGCRRPPTVLHCNAWGTVGTASSSARSRPTITTVPRADATVPRADVTARLGVIHAGRDVLNTVEAVEAHARAGRQAVVLAVSKRGCASHWPHRDDTRAPAGCAVVDSRSSTILALCGTGAARRRCSCVHDHSSDLVHWSRRASVLLSHLPAAVAFIAGLQAHTLIGCAARRLMVRASAPDITSRSQPRVRCAAQLYASSMTTTIPVLAGPIDVQVPHPSGGISQVQLPRIAVTVALAALALSRAAVTLVCGPQRIHTAVHLAVQGVLLPERHHNLSHRLETLQPPCVVRWIRRRRALEQVICVRPCSALSPQGIVRPNTGVARCSQQLVSAPPCFALGLQQVIRVPAATITAAAAAIGLQQIVCHSAASGSRVRVLGQ